MRIGKRIISPRISDALWKKEIEFSDWLVTEDGVALLSNDLGIEVENLKRESRPGNYPCDIAGNRLGDESHVVVIENQLGRTNHDHLAKLLTYAAVHKAMTGIWIAEVVSDDHRQVIDWLNENTPPSIGLYLAELKACKIGDSDWAPMLEVVSRPNTMVKETRAEFSEAENKRNAWRLETWQGIHQAIAAAKPPFRLQRPGMDHWSSIAVGRSGFSLNMLLTPKNKSVVVGLYIDVPWKDSAFDDLISQKSKIESELGMPLKWDPLPGKKSARIYLEEAIDPKDAANAEAVRNWFCIATVAMYKAFHNRVGALKEVQRGKISAATFALPEPE